MVVIIDLEDEEDIIETHNEITTSSQTDAPVQLFITKIITKSKLEQEKEYDDFCARIAKQNYEKRRRRLEIYQKVSHLAKNKTKNATKEYKKLLEEIDIDMLASLVYDHKDVSALIFMLTKGITKPSLRMSVNSWMIRMLEHHMELLNENAMCAYCLCAVAGIFSPDLSLVLSCIKYINVFIIKAVVAGLCTRLEKKKNMISSEAIEEFWKDYSVQTRQVARYPESVIMPVPNFPAFVTLDHTAAGPVTEVLISERLPEVDPEPPKKHIEEEKAVANELQEDAPKETQVLEEDVIEIVEEVKDALKETPASEEDIIEIVEEIEAASKEAPVLDEIVKDVTKKRRKKQKLSFEDCDTVTGVETMFCDWKCFGKMFGNHYELSQTEGSRAADILDMYKQFALFKKRTDDYYVSANVSTEKKLQSMEQALRALEHKYVRIEEKKLIRRNLTLYVYFTI